MKEIDFLPQWYQNKVSRQNSYRRQYLMLAGLLAVLFAWSFTSTVNLSKARANVKNMEHTLENNQPVASKYDAMEILLTHLYQKASIIEKYNSHIIISNIIAELSYLMEDRVILNKLDIQSELYQPVSQDNSSSLKFSLEEAKSQNQEPAKKSRYKVVLTGIAGNSDDVTSIIAQLEDSPYFCKVIPALLQSDKDSIATQFRINCYIENYIEK